ncbi:MAG: L-2-hydroxyglutarate oxidase [Balneolaceae bacterium]
MTVDFAIVGAGIVGLSTAWKLSLRYPDASIAVFEKEPHVAAHQTGRNSGVIHSGIYYQPGSYKAKNCVDGRHQLVSFCREHGVAHEVCGKVIVATTEEETPSLESIYQRGIKNGIEGIEMLNRNQTLAIEPHVAAVASIHVPCAGIVDYAGVCNALARLLRQSGHAVHLNSEIQSIQTVNGHCRLTAAKQTVEAGVVIGCGGLQSDRLAASGGIQSDLKIVPFRGEYFTLKPHAEHLVRSLIYPVPNPDFPFLGVHFTRMATGGIECGPNAVFAFEREGYSTFSFDLQDTLDTVDFPGFWKLAHKHWRMGLDEWVRSISKKAFLTKLQKLIPAVGIDDIEPSPSGVRAMALRPDGTLVDDFHIEQKGTQFHVLNAPSPAATAGLAIGDEICNRVSKTLG